MSEQFEKFTLKENLEPVCHDKEVFTEKDKDFDKDLNEPKFKGLDGKEYSDRLSMERANKAWTRKMNSYKGLDGQYYEDRFAMEEADRRYTEQMNPKKKKEDY